MTRREAGLIEAGKIYGKEAEAALREHLSMIGDEYYEWQADLYIGRKCVCDNFDEEGNRICLLPRDENGKCICTGGGYYYCNSARDTDGYEIDIESTVQALRFIVSTGIAENHSGDLKKAMPKQMQKDVIAFAKSLQYADDGYFYHPQWGKNIVPSRQGRDLGWATSIIKDLGDMPLYDTKNGHKGSLGAPTGNISDDGSVDSKSTWTPQLKDLDAFKEYLESFDLKTKSYSTGNTFSAQSGQINGRDAQAMADGEAHDENGDGIAEDGFVSAYEKHFNERQNAENGLWEDEVHYNSVNGLMKISSTYNSLKIKLNHAEAAFKSAMQMALLPIGVADVKGKLTTGSVDVYNPWVAIQHILSNVKRFGTEEEYNGMKKMLADNAVALIKATTEKTRKFKKPDGSFGYTWSCPPSCSQQAPVCPKGIIEGDVNGGNIATNGIWTNMCNALGLKIPIFSGEDYEKYFSRIKKNCGYN